MIPACGDRPVDVLFMGHDSGRRQAFFARHAEFFARRNCHLVLVDVSAPRRTDTPGYYAGSNRLALLASSKILINVHSTERSYFETHRALLAMGNRCLFVSETSRYTAPLVNGRHFLMADLDDLPAACAQYLDDPPALAAVASAGYEFVRDQVTIAGMTPAGYNGLFTVTAITGTTFTLSFPLNTVTDPTDN